MSGRAEDAPAVGRAAGPRRAMPSVRSLCAAIVVVLMANLAVGLDRLDRVLPATATVALAASATPTPTPEPTPTPVQGPAAPDPSPWPPVEGQPLGRPAVGGTTYPPAPARQVEHGDRVAWWTGYGPMAVFGDLVVHHPARIVEHVGLHQSNHEGARDLSPVEGAAGWSVLPSRGRLSGLQSAADVVVPPEEELRAPVSGTVLRAGTYTLYCDTTDEYLVIEPDGMPGFEVKMLHIVGLQVAAGQRVEAGATTVALHAHLLPFRSQVDARTGEPSWPHTHVEVVDTAIPNQPNGGSGSTC